MKKIVVYIHGMGGNAEEAEHYKPLFPDYDVIGFDYQSETTPWEAKNIITTFFAPIFKEYDYVIVIANSIGAFFAIYSLNDTPLDKAFFISPIVSMEELILNTMKWLDISEDEMQKKRVIVDKSSGKILSWDYLLWLRNHPIEWNIPTFILYGEKDNLQGYETIKYFSGKTNANLTIMKNGEHWFHTDEQLSFLDNWIKDKKDKG